MVSTDVHQLEEVDRIPGNSIVTCENWHVLFKTLLAILVDTYLINLNHNLTISNIHVEFIPCN